MKFNKTLAFTYLAAGAIALGTLTIPKDVSAANGWMSTLSLPSAGVAYALSAKKVSVRDVKKKVAAKEAYQSAQTSQQAKQVTTAGVANVIEKAAPLTMTAVVTTASNGDVAISSADASSADASSASSDSSEADTEAPAEKSSADDSTEETAKAIREAVESADKDDSIVDTTLTSSQQKEKEVVDSASGKNGVSSQEVSEKDAVVAAVNTTKEDSSSEGSSDDSSEDASSEGTSESADSADASSESTDSSDAQSDAADSASSADTSSQQSDEELVASVANDFVYVREQPSADAKIVGKLYANSIGKVVEEADENGWIKITSGDVTGYVKQDYVAQGSQAQQIADSHSTKQAKVTTQTLKVRAAASTDSDVISLIGNGQQLDIISESDGWYKVNTEDGEGYISADFADVEVQYPEAVSIEEEEKEAEEAKKKEEEKEAASKSSSSSSSSSTGKSSGSTAKQSASGASKGQQVVNYAMQFLGNPYVWGGSSLTNGTDCSGFTMSVYAHFGVSLPHYDAAQRSCGTSVGSLSAARPGDLVCYDGHVGIYIGGGQIVNASNPRTGITVTNATYRQILAIRRIFN
ncbi:MAG: SH3 domain-containing protein [Lachnospiraceae bacterium]|nr:SH3 domain-containing protein [Lachnospiraceae bacterium]